MAPILSFLITSGSKKKEPRYICRSEAKALNLNNLRVQEMYSDILFISLKSPGKRTPFRFPKRTLIEREARLQDILHISQKPHLSRSPVKEPSLRCSRVDQPQKNDDTTFSTVETTKRSQFSFIYSVMKWKYVTRMSRRLRSTVQETDLKY